MAKTLTAPPETRVGRNGWKPRFGLRSILILMAVCAVLTLIVGQPATQHMREQTIIQRIEKLGGTTVVKSVATPGFRTWLADALGRRDVFDRVVAVDLSEKQVSGEDLQLIGELVELEGVFLQSSSVTDMSLAGLSNLTKLAAVDVSSTAVSNEGAKSLPSTVRTLFSFNTTIDHATLKQLNIDRQSTTSRLERQVKNANGVLSSFSANRFDPFISVEGEESAKLLLTRQKLFGCDERWVSLRVHLYDDDTTDETLAIAGEVPRLTALHVTSEEISDQGIIALAKNRELIDLRVFDAPVTPACLKCLQQLGQLKTLVLPVSAKPADVDAFRRSMPNLETLQFGADADE